MKTVILARHARASRKDLPIPDKERPLRESGKSDLARMKDPLLRHSQRPEHVFSSTANRAAQTAAILAGFYGLCDRLSFFDDLYHPDERGMLEFIRRLDDDVRSVMVVGHNPELEELADLLRGDGQSTSLPTSACICLSFDVDRWNDVRKNQGVLEYFEYPKKYRIED